MNIPTPNVFLCNGASKPTTLPPTTKNITLNYAKADPKRVINLKLPKFVDQVYHLPNRVLDLLEIAAYVFAADRMVCRGPKAALEFHAWPRSMQFCIRVREADFWNREQVKKKLAEVLVFMTGDRDYVFDFFPGHSTPPSSLFDNNEFTLSSDGEAAVVLFSGGLDSLAGVLKRLNTTKETLYLVSHQSGQPSTKKTQAKLFDSLIRDYPGRLRHYPFECGLSNVRAAEETQRTRAFLFGSIAFALSSCLSLTSFYAYENGVTSLNLLRRQDLINARASRTTHPKTLVLMSEFLSEIQEQPVKVLNPFWQYTKTDIFELLKELNGSNLVGSTVSCSKTFQRLESGTHCGCCFQCIDRRFASYAAGLDHIDNVGIYSKDVFIDPIDSQDTRTTALDYIRQAVNFAKTNEDAFYLERLAELADILVYIDTDEADAFEKILQLCHRNGNQIVSAIKRIRNQHDDPRYNVKRGSLLQLLADREYLKNDARRLAERISETLASCIPIAYKNTRPNKEDDLNNQIDALLRAHSEDFRREFPTTQFALAKVVPDHEANNADLLVEAKYVRGNTSPSKTSEGIAADITKYPSEKFILFVVYDPDRAISDDIKFKKDIESKRDSIVAVIR
jgi:7-cyano-7-deazaguanine synthase in queuosine biosynthesis